MDEAHRRARPAAGRRGRSRVRVRFPCPVFKKTSRLWMPGLKGLKNHAALNKAEQATITSSKRWFGVRFFRLRNAHARMRKVRASASPSPSSFPESGWCREFLQDSWRLKISPAFCAVRVRPPRYHMGDKNKISEYSSSWNHQSLFSS